MMKAVETLKMIQEQGGINEFGKTQKIEMLTELIAPFEIETDGDSDGAFIVGYHDNNELFTIFSSAMEDDEEEIIAQAHKVQLEMELEEIEKLFNNPITRILRVVTHSQVFHADEIACQALIELAKQALVPFLRTRDENYEKQEGDIVVDVFGGEFDHHTEEKLDRFGNKLSSIGLLWARYKNEFMELLGLNQSLVRPLETVIQSLDKMDNGEKADNVLAFNQVIGAFNAPDIAENDENFRQAVDFMKIYLEQVITNCKLLQLKYDKAWEEKELDGKVVKLNGYVPDWEQRAIDEGLNVQFACTFEPWASQYSVQRTKENTFDLNQLKDVQGVTFTHGAGFLAKVNTDYIENYLQELSALI